MTKTIFTKETAEQAIEVFKQNTNYLDTDCTVEYDEVYITLQVKEAGKTGWLSEVLLKEVVNFALAYDTLAKNLFWYVGVIGNEPVVFICFQIQ